ncbi:MAG TPA: HAD hydrolase-like protein [Bosea sp. (in: a-proteobacteria)]
MPYKLIIFDFDGTLADTFPWFASVLNGVADRYRFRRIAPDEVETLRGHSARHLIAHLGVSRWKLPFIARHMRRLAAGDVASVAIFPGIEAMLCQLRQQGFVLAIVSSNTESNIRRVLGDEMAALFTHFACGAGLFGKATKFRQLARVAGIEHGQCLCIGDEIRDFEAASEAGMAFGAVGWGFTSAAALRALGPSFMFEHPDDIRSQLLDDEMRALHAVNSRGAPERLINPIPGHRHN